MAVFIACDRHLRGVVLHDWTYLEVVPPSADLQEMWGKMVLNILGRERLLERDREEYGVVVIAPDLKAASRIR